MAYDDLIPGGTTGYIIEVFARDTSTGQGKTGLAYTAVSFKYARQGASSLNTSTPVVDGTLGTWVSGGWKELGSGWYQFGVPNAVVASGVGSVGFSLHASGMIDISRRILLTTSNLRVSTPAVAPGVSGGLPTDVELNARTLPSANYATASALATVAGYIDLEIGQIITALGNVQADTDALQTAVGTAQSDLTAILAYVDNVETLINAFMGIGWSDETLVLLKSRIDDVRSRIPASLTGAGNMKSDAVAVSGSVPAATNLLAMLVDGLGTGGVLNLKRLQVVSPDGIPVFIQAPSTASPFTNPPAIQIYAQDEFADAVQLISGGQAFAIRMEGGNAGIYLPGITPLLGEDAMRALLIHPMGYGGAYDTGTLGDTLLDGVVDPEGIASAVDTTLSTVHGDGSWEDAGGGGGATPEEIAEAVWTNDERTLTGGGGGGAGLTAEEVIEAVWVDAPNRSLTQSGNQVAAITAGGAISLMRGDRLSIPRSGLGSLASVTEIWFTVKRVPRSETDNEAILQISLTGGMLRLNGESVSSSLGSITVTDEESGTIMVTVNAEASSQLIPEKSLYWDIQLLGPEGPYTPKRGTCSVESDVSRVTA